MSDRDQLIRDLELEMRECDSLRAEVARLTALVQERHAQVAALNQENISLRAAIVDLGKTAEGLTTQLERERVDAQAHAGQLGDVIVKAEAQVAGLGEAVRKCFPFAQEIAAHRCQRWTDENRSLPEFGPCTESWCYPCAARRWLPNANDALTPDVERRVAERKALEACAKDIEDFVAYCDGMAVESERPSFLVQVVGFLLRFRQALAALRAAREGQP